MITNKYLKELSVIVCGLVSGLVSAVALLAFSFFSFGVLFGPSGGAAIKPNHHGHTMVHMLEAQNDESMSQVAIAKRLSVEHCILASFKEGISTLEEVQAYCED